MICKLSAVRCCKISQMLQEIWLGNIWLLQVLSWSKLVQALSSQATKLRICLFPNSMWYRVVLNHSGSTPVAMLRLSLPLGGHNRYQRPWRWWERRSWRCAWKKCVKAAVPGTLLLESAVLPAWSMKLPEGAHLILEQDLVYFLWGGEAEMFSKVIPHIFCRNMCFCLFETSRRPSRIWKLPWRKPNRRSQSFRRRLWER